MLNVFRRKQGTCIELKPLSISMGDSRQTRRSKEVEAKGFQTQTNFISCSLLNCAIRLL